MHKICLKGATKPVLKNMDSFSKIFEEPLELDSAAVKNELDHTKDQSSDNEQFASLLSECMPNSPWPKRTLSMSSCS
ncbi:hypothetical protein HDV02_006315, partial [Globomyces sp. JEL0801]